jgi:hypothetical protein
MQVVSSVSPTFPFYVDVAFIVVIVDFHIMETFILMKHVPNFICLFVMNALYSIFQLSLQSTSFLGGDSSDLLQVLLCVSDNPASHICSSTNS